MITKEQLLPFCGDCEYREWLNEPFISGGRVVATDSHLIVSLPPDIADCTGIVKNTQKVPVYEKEFWKPFDTAAFAAFLKTLPLSEETVTETENIPCPECHGKGEVAFEYFALLDGRTYQTYDECPICEGTGVIEEDKTVKTGRMVTDDDLTVGLSYNGVTSFYPYRIFRKLADALAVIEPDQTYLTLHDGRTTVVTARRKMMKDADAPFIAFAAVLSNKETVSEHIFEIE